jgi:hypothetical protein
MTLHYFFSTSNFLYTPLFHTGTADIDRRQLTVANASRRFIQVALQHLVVRHRRLGGYATR